MWKDYLLTAYRVGTPLVDVGKCSCRGVGTIVPISRDMRLRNEMGVQDDCMRGSALKIAVQPYVRGRDRRVLLGSRVLPSTAVAVAELARRNKRSVSAEVNAAVQAHLEQYAVH